MWHGTYAVVLVPLIPLQQVTCVSDRFLFDKRFLNRKLRHSYQLYHDVFLGQSTRGLRARGTKVNTGRIRRMAGEFRLGRAERGEFSNAQLDAVCYHPVNLSSPGNNDWHYSHDPI